MNRIIHTLGRCVGGWRGRRKITGCLAFTLLLLLLGSAQRSSAAIIYVTTLQSGIGTGACSLAEAIYASNLQASIAINGYTPDPTANSFTNRLRLITSTPDVSPEPATT